MNRNDFSGNITTIAKILVCIIAPTVAVWLGTSENVTIALLTAVVGLIFSLFDAKYPNTIFDDSYDEVGVVIDE